jgi:DNA-binding NarL/FixJ family response regulator
MDEEGASLEFAAARETFKNLGATSDIARLDAARAVPANASGLSSRELQVLRLVAAGKSNKLIASDLSLSEKTIDRHISNIFNKLDVSSRTAAAAWAFQRRLI